MSKKTNCTSCSKEILYTTKKPSTCKDCKTSKTKKKKSRYRRPSKKNTKGEVALFKVLDKLLGDYQFINHGYYSFIRSPKNAPLQLDRYYPEIRLAFEYDGELHETYSKFIHKTQENFEYYKRCDQLKTKLCKGSNITLVRIHWKIDITEETVKEAIKKENDSLYKGLFT